jgi:hypothetical protein
MKSKGSKGQVALLSAGALMALTVALLEVAHSASGGSSSSTPAPMVSTVSQSVASPAPVQSSSQKVASVQTVSQPTTIGGSNAVPRGDGEAEGGGDD